jgi:hypothetical protein
MARQPGDRYEPFPGLTKVPGWLWKRMGRGARIGAVVAAVLVAAGVIALIPVLSDVRRDNREDERRDRAAARAADIRRVNAIQRPRTATGPRDDPRAAVRVLQSRILTDSNHRRGLNPARRVECTLGARTRQVGRYSCTAVTARVVNADGDAAYGITGYPYRAVVEFRTGGLTWCKVVGRAGEGSLYSRNPTPVPRACTG